MRLAIWKISVEACTDSTGGHRDIYAFTPNARILPDPFDALMSVSTEEIQAVDSVQLLYEGFGVFCPGTSDGLSDTLCEAFSNARREQ